MKQYFIAKLYPQIQMYATSTLEHSSMAQWNDEPPIEHITRHLLTGYKDTCKIITSEIWRELQYQIIHRAYLPYFYTSKELKPGKNNFTSTCPKHSKSKPTLKHTLWDCPKIQKYWDGVTLYLRRITRERVFKNPYKYLLNINQPMDQTGNIKKPYQNK